MSESTPTIQRPKVTPLPGVTDANTVRLIVVPDLQTRGQEPGRDQGPVQLSRRQWPTRLFDILIASAAILLMLPILLLAALAVWRTSTGPIIYRQVRCGLNGRHFVIYKYRTMVDGADVLLHRDQQQASDFKQRWKLDDDPRVTWIGGWLRKTSIDELPQLWNVIRGDMSLVGPRPVRPEELEECYGAFASQVFSIKPGLTGLWQVTGRSDVSYETRIALDLEYLQKRSVWYDSLLLVRTIPAVLMMRGAV